MLGGQDGQNIDIRPWQGNMVVKIKDPSDGTGRLLFNGAEVVSDLGPETSVWIQPESYLALDVSNSRLLSVTPAGAEPLDLQGCPVSLDGGLLLRSSGDSATHRLQTAEGVSVDLPQGSVFDPRGGHLVYTMPGDGVSTVTAFSEEDLKVQGS